MKAQTIGARQILDMFKEAFAEFSKDNVMRLSAALSYYSIFSIAPLLMIAIGIAGWFYGEKAAQGDVAREIGQFVGPQAAQAIQSILESASKSSGGATIIGFVTLFVGASTVFGQLKDALNIVWKVRQKSGLGVWHFLKTYLLNFGLVLAVGFLLLISLLLTTIVAGMGTWLQHQFGIPGFVSGIAGFVAPFTLEVVMFAAIFKVLPDAEIELRSVWVGAVVTALLFELGKVGLSFYLGRGGATSSFGAAGSVVLLLLWIYYASCILFYGAEFTEVYARKMGHEVRPSALAEATEVWTEHGRLPAACADAPVVSGVSRAVPVEMHPFASDEPVPSVPPRESLAPLMEEPELDPALFAQRHGGRPDSLHGWVEKANEHPVAELGAALGVGLVAGMLMRLFEGPPKEVSAKEHLELGSKAAAAAGIAAIAGMRPWIEKNLDRKSLGRMAKAGRKQAMAAKREISEKVDSILH